jgi:hypothetical protein
VTQGATGGRLLLLAAWLWVALMLAAYLAQFLPLLRPILALTGLG